MRHQLIRQNYGALKTDFASQKCIHYKLEAMFWFSWAVQKVFIKMSLLENTIIYDDKRTAALFEIYAFDYDLG